MLLGNQPKVGSPDEVQDKHCTQQIWSSQEEVCPLCHELGLKLWEQEFFFYKQASWSKECRAFHCFVNNNYKVIKSPSLWGSPHEVLSSIRDCKSFPVAAEGGLELWLLSWPSAPWGGVLVCACCREPCSKSQLLAGILSLAGSTP